MEEKKVFGYTNYEAEGEKILTTYDNAYRDMMMDIRVYKYKGHTWMNFICEEEETAILLLKGEVTFDCEEIHQTVSRESVFTEGPWALHFCAGTQARVTIEEEAEILVQRTHNDNQFPAKLYSPADAPWGMSTTGKFGNVANRSVNTILDHDIAPWSNMVLGEVMNRPGNWSGYLPHRHPQPETYYFLFDRPEGFGASFVGDQVFKSVNGSFSAIPGGELHPQAVAPGFRMYTCWMIRHLPDDPWLQTDRCEDEAYTWLHEYEPKMENPQGVQQKGE